MKDLNSKENILLAQVVATKGLKGELKVKSFTQDPLSILDYEVFTDKGVSLTISSGYIHKGVVIVKIDGINTVEQAEKLIGTKLFTKRKNMPQLEEETFYYVDLIGLDVLNSKNEKIGIVFAVQNYGSGDFLEIKKTDGSIEAIMFTKENVPEVNIQKSYIKVVDINYVNIKEMNLNNKNS